MMSSRRRGAVRAAARQLPHSRAILGPTPGQHGMRRPARMPAPEPGAADSAAAALGSRGAGGGGREPTLDRPRFYEYGYSISFEHGSSRRARSSQPNRRAAILAIQEERCDVLGRTTTFPYTMRHACSHPILPPMYPGNSQSNQSLRYSGAVHPQCSLDTPNERATAFSYKARNPAPRTASARHSTKEVCHSPKSTLMK